MKLPAVIKRNTAVEIIASVFILLFVYTAVSKLVTFQTFKEMLKFSPLIGDRNVILAWVLPISELIVSLLLFIPRTRKWGLYLSLALMLVFTIYIGYMLLFTTNRPCNCGGVLNSMTWNQHLGFNIFFAVLAWIGIRMEKRNLSASPNATSFAV